MKRSLTITDLTRMQRKTVCIAGYDDDGQCVRPVLPPPGIPESALSSSGKAFIVPFAVVEFDLTQSTPRPPHTEDYRYDPKSPRFVRGLNEREKRDVLRRSLFGNVAAIFEQPVLRGPGYYVMDGCGPRSIGTIQPRGIHEAIYAPGERGEEEAWDYRLGFFDKQGDYYRLKITDLTWHYYCDSLRGEDRDPPRIAPELTKLLKSREVYLRIGLARGWARFPDRCYLQITGIYTFPDYTQGKTFADFAAGS